MTKEALWDGIGWLSQVVGSLRAPSVLITICIRLPDRLDGVKMDLIFEVIFTNPRNLSFD